MNYISRPKPLAFVFPRGVQTFLSYLIDNRRYMSTLKAWVLYLFFLKNEIYLFFYIKFEFLGEKIRNKKTEKINFSVFL